MTYQYDTKANIKTIQIPSQNFSFLNNEITIPNILLFSKKSQLLKEKFNLIDKNTNKIIFSCSAKTIADKFKLSDKNNNKIYEFELEKKKSCIFDLKFIDIKTGNKKEAHIELEKSNGKIFKITFINNLTEGEELLYVYSNNLAVFIYYGGKENEGGCLIAKAIGTYKNVLHPEYTFELASNNIDKSFILMILISILHYTERKK
ncbi:hypothetical protein BCR32DRAFT_288740 [Anaeromyces robustus]|uniref:Tubby C-terminal domain-containing protein n=1 Tax=Anaeromyces robustus TaxID=1754192 RepID=A0A1Y1XSE0_9FUNG|nr:hypothetical protein BCR32DRAFT_288740 [Anaeromyces robustus]|eukprot:ORX88224.1 hypothetical protein BCR32DRAFT_288740 [Anaeromyces robustus]